MKIKKKVKLQLHALKLRLVEFIKYDCPLFQMPLVGLSAVLIGLLLVRKRYYKALIVCGKIFTMGWPLSFQLGVWLTRRIFSSSSAKTPIQEQIVHELSNSVQPLAHTQKFFDDPAAILKASAIVIKSPTTHNKGVILLKYSYYFPLFLKFFDVAAVVRRYHLVFEPSWAGLCEVSILSYAMFGQPQFVMAYEPRDWVYLKAIRSHFVPLSIGPNWFVNHQNFVPPPTDAVRDIDIVMVAGWSDFKRHWFFFKTLKQVVQTSPHVRVALAGYPGERTLQDIREWALFWGIEQHLQFHEWISPQEVSLLMQRSKVNVLWSRFEGNNRALVEGMLCDTPCILRKGHNYGYHYDYINAQTGIYASESDLAEKLLYMIEHHKEFSPRNYILNNHSFERATQLLGQSIREVECSETTVPWEGVLAYKINELHGMQYFSAESEQLFAEDYAFLRTLIRHAAGSAQKNQRPFFETSGLEH